MGDYDDEQDRGNELEQQHQTQIKREPKRRASFIKGKKSMRPSVYEGDVLFEGLAEKRATGRLRSAWQSRYFVAVGHYLTYYADSRRGKLKGAIDLHALRSVTRGPVTNKSPYGLRELHLANKEHKLSADAKRALQDVAAAVL